MANKLRVKEFRIPHNALQTLFKQELSRIYQLETRMEKIETNQKNQEKLPLESIPQDLLSILDQINQQLNTLGNSVTNLENKLNTLETNLQEIKQLLLSEHDDTSQYNSNLNSPHSETAAEITSTEEATPDINLSPTQPQTIESETEPSTASETTDTTETTPPIEDKNQDPRSLLAQLVAEEYNNPNTDLLKNAIEVSGTEDSINQRRFDSSLPAIFEKASKKGKGNYLILQRNGVEGNITYLVPKKNLKINEFNYKTVQVLFDCRDYQTGINSQFKLLEAAIVTPTSGGEQWVILRRGVLKFELNE